MLYKKYYYINSAGSFIEQDRADVTLRTTAIAPREMKSTGRLSLGSRGDFSRIQGLHQQIKETAQRAVDMLAAPHAKGGESPLYGPVLAGVFYPRGLRTPLRS
jgi:TldD protein